MAQTRSRKRKSDQDQVVEEPTNAASQQTTDSSRETSLPVRSKDGESSVPTKGTLKVFGDDDEAEVPTTTAPVSTKKEEIEEAEDSDDDEAPEAVSTTQAALDIKKATQAAQKAAKEQAAADKRKRQQRDERFKLQAEERKKVEEEAKAAEAAAAVELKKQEEDDSRQTGRRRVDKTQIPALLPAEFLTDSSSESEDEDAPSANQRHKRRKVSGIENKLSRQGRGPRDEIVGSTAYRVAKETDQKLAPKAKKYAKSTKEVLLKRNRAAVKPKSGFITRK